MYALDTNCWDRNAWSGVRGMKSIDAMKEYILIVTCLCPNWFAEAQSRSPEDPAMMTQEEINKDLQWEGSDTEEAENGAGLGLGVTFSTMAAGQE